MTTIEQTANLPLESGTWQVDSVHSNVEFTVRHMGISKVRGRFNTFTAELVVGETIESTQVRAAIDLGSVDTNNADRDNHIRSTDFFNTDENPKMTFVSTGIVEKDGEYELQGDLTLNGITHPIALEVELNGLETNPMSQALHAGFSATGSLSRKQYGVEFDVPLGGDKVLISDKVNLDLEIQFVRAS